MGCEGCTSAEQHPRHAISVVRTSDELRTIPPHVPRRPVRETVERLSLAVISPEHDTRGSGVEWTEVTSAECGTKNVSLDVEFRHAEPNTRESA
jgi:hypothetical protein